MLVIVLELWIRTIKSLWFTVMLIMHYIYCYLSLLKGISGCGSHIQLEQVWNEHIVSSKYIYNIVIVS